MFAAALALIAGLALLLGLGRLSGHPKEGASAGPATPVAGPVRALRVTVLSTMLTDAAGVGEWGFSALVEADGKRLLFDTGGRPDTVLNNARELGIDLSNIEDVILSHHH
ncbi:MAG TPA: MBL fold metallo-hydrolase [Chthoniobacterales bacterium]